MSVRGLSFGQVGQSFGEARGDGEPVGPYRPSPRRRLRPVVDHLEHGVTVPNHIHWLVDVFLRAESERSLHVGPAGRRGKDHDGNVTLGIAFEDFQPRELQQAQIQDYHRRVEALVGEHGERLLTVAGDVKFDRQVGFSQDLVRQQRVTRAIFDKQHFGLRHGGVTVGHLGSGIVSGERDVTSDAQNAHSWGQIQSKHPSAAPR